MRPVGSFVFIDESGVFGAGAQFFFGLGLLKAQDTAPLTEAVHLSPRRSAAEGAILRGEEVDVQDAVRAAAARRSSAAGIERGWSRCVYLLTMTCHLSILIHMSSPDTDADRLLRLSARLGAFRLADAREQGIHPETVYRLVRRGELERVGRGVYRAAEAMVSAHHGLVLATLVAPAGVVCLLSALSFHELTTQLPFEVWVAIDRRAAAPRDPAVPLRIMRFSGAALTLGAEAHELEGTQVRVYAAAKTVIDCFRYRNLVGMDVAIEALRDCLRQNKSSPGELWELAQQCRIGSVMRPYIEALA